MSMSKPLMAKATAVWLVDNTTLSFAQIADFCGMHELEVQGIADGDVATGVKGFDPIANNQLDPVEIERARKLGLPVRTDFAEFHRDYEFMGAQRHLKAIGIFARLNLRDGKPGYLRDIPRTLGYVVDIAERYPELAGLCDLLRARGVDRWQPAP